MSPKHDVSEERKSQILDAAMDTFSEMGFHKARMSDIAETSGLSKGSLYWYFDSKDSIFWIEYLSRKLRILIFYSKIHSQLKAA